MGHDRPHLLFPPRLHHHLSNVAAEQVFRVDPHSGADSHWYYHHDYNHLFLQV